MRRLLKRSLFTIISTTALMLGGMPIGIAYLYTRASLYGACGNAALPLPETLSQAESAQSIRFQPDGSFWLDGWYLPGTEPAVIVILPGLNGGRDSMAQEANFLHEAGYHILTIESRRCAEPPQKSTLGYAEIADLRAALDWLETNTDIKRFGAFGHSVGGAVVLMTAAEDTRLRAVVATGNYSSLNDLYRENTSLSFPWFESWFRSWLARFYRWETGINPKQLSPIDRIGAISPRAVFLIHGTREQTAEGIAQYSAAGDPRQLWIVEGARHGGYARADYDGYKNRSITFFDRYLLNDP